MKRKNFINLLTFFIAVFVIFSGVDFSIYVFLHTHWIKNLESIIGIEKVSALGYGKGIFSSLDSHFSNFTMSYIIISLAANTAVSLVVTFIYRSIRKKSESYERKAVRKLDELIIGKESSDDTDTTSLIDEKIHQVLTVYRKKDSDLIKERESINKLINDISHQIKTPLASISIYNELMKDENLSTDERFEFISQIEAQTEKIKMLFDSLIKIARLENNLIEVSKENADIVTTVKSAIKDVSGKAEMRNISLILKSDTEKHVILHDIMWTKEALVNIIDNAVKYSHPDSDVRITIETGDVHTEIKITNKGIGISKNEVNDIFKRFYRSRKAAEANISGSGLGLNIAREIMIKQYGYITVYSDEVYTDEVTFCVFLQNCQTSVR